MSQSTPEKRSCIRRQGESSISNGNSDVDHTNVENTPPTEEEDTKDELSHNNTTKVETVTTDWKSLQSAAIIEDYDSCGEMSCVSLNVSSLSEYEDEDDRSQDGNLPIRNVRSVSPLPSHGQTRSKTHRKEGNSVENEKKRSTKTRSKLRQKPYLFVSPTRNISAQSQISKVGELVNSRNDCDNHPQHYRQGSTIISFGSPSSKLSDGQTTSTSGFKQSRRRRRKSQQYFKKAVSFENLDNTSWTRSNRQRKILKSKPGCDSSETGAAIQFRKTNSGVSVNSMYTSLTALRDESVSAASFSLACSAVKSSIVVNGKVVNDIKYSPRPRTAPHKIGGSEGVEESDQSFHHSIGRKSVTVDQLDELKTSSNIETLHLELEAVRRRRRRRRPVKDDMKYIVGKIVPTPLKGVKAALTKRKRYDLERSRGCLT